MSHPILSLMNSFNKTESAVFNFWILYFQRIPFSNSLRSQLLSLCRVMALESLLFIDLVLLYSHFLVFRGCWIHNFLDSRVALNPGLGGVSHLPFSLMNRLNKTESAVFNFWILYSKGSPFQIIRIYHEFVDRIDNSVPRVTAWHHEALPSDAKQRPEGQICLSCPRTHDRFFFLHTLGASVLINPVLPLNTLHLRLPS